MNIREYTKYKERKSGKSMEVSSQNIRIGEEVQDIQKEYEKKIRKHRINVVLLAALVVMICVVGVGAWYIYSANITYTGYQVVNSIERTDADTAKYVPYNGGMLKYSNDGAAFIGADLKEKWNHTYQMQEPLYAICQSAVALADKNGTTIFILNESGLRAEVNTLLPIKKLDISAQGVTAASLEDSGKSWIKLYSPETSGEELAATKILMEESGYPVDLCLSDDGIKFGISHLNIEDGQAKSTLAFHNLGSVGENEIDNFVGSTSYAGSVFPVFDYINSDTSVAYGNDRVEVFSGKQIPELSFELTLEEEIEKVFYNESYIGMVLKNTQNTGKYRMDIYDLKGKKIFSESYDKEYTNVLISGETILMYNESECCIYSIKGVCKFEKNLDSTILAMAVTGNNRYMLITEDNIEIIKLVR